MTDLEKRAITALRSVKMAEQLWHARRAEDLDWLMTLDPNRRLVGMQDADLWYLAWRYRRQIVDREVVAHAIEIVKGAMSLAF